MVERGLAQRVEPPSAPMICESCHQNLATVHLTEIVQKQKKELNLCEECLRGKGEVVKGNFTVHGSPGGVSDATKKKGASSKEGAEKAKAKPAAEKPKPAEIGPCPACGLTFPEFKASGRLGCHADYEHFKKELLPLLEKIHGATQHTGRVPARVDQHLEAQKVLSALRKDLNVAIQREEYERAASLRDKIKTMESAAPEVPGDA